jgi:protein-disulfide isomerase-like protein with CxxC motif
LLVPWHNLQFIHFIQNGHYAQGKHDPNENNAAKLGEKVGADHRVVRLRQRALRRQVVASPGGRLVAGFEAVDFGDEAIAQP